MKRFREYINEKNKGLENKSKETGVPYNILKQVYDRGMAAWKSGHRPGVAQQQWAMGRVNSFLTYGKNAKKQDKDLFDKLSSSLQSKIKSVSEKKEEDVNAPKKYLTKDKKTMKDEIRKHKDKDDDDKSAYKKWPADYKGGDTSGKPHKTRKSSSTVKYKKAFGKDKE